MNSKSPKKQCHVAVIGAGISGLCALRNFALDSHYDVTCFEIRDRVGGLWNYPAACEAHPGCQLDISSAYFSRIYRHLRTNTFRDVTELRDFHYPNDKHNFLTHEEVLQYLQRYTTEFDLSKHIKFRHKVSRVRPIQPDWTSADGSLGPQWSVTTENLATGGSETSIFDVVTVCNGHHNVPYIPDVPTMDKFNGQVLHSAFYRTPEPYNDKTVLIIGAGPSANDLTCELMDYAKKIVLKRSTLKDVFANRKRFPKIFPAPEELRFTEKGFLNDDGSVEKLDAVLLGTGYLYDFPFLSPECKVEVKRGQVEPLYRFVIHREYPTMAFIGLLVAAPVAVGFEDQVLYYKAYLDEKFQLPSKEDMKKDADGTLKKFMDMGFKEHHSLLVVPLKDRLYPYVNQLAEEGGFAPVGKALEDLVEVNNDLVVYKPYDLRQYTYEKMTKDDETSFIVHEAKKDA